MRQLLVAKGDSCSLVIQLGAAAAGLGGKSLMHILPEEGVGVGDCTCGKGTNKGQAEQRAEAESRQRRQRTAAAGECAAAALGRSTQPAS